MLGLLAGFVIATVLSVTVGLAVALVRTAFRDAL